MSANWQNRTIVVSSRYTRTLAGLPSKESHKSRAEEWHGGHRNGE